MTQSAMKKDNKITELKKTTKTSPQLAGLKRTDLSPEQMAAVRRAQRLIDNNYKD